jgi:hypothetical protein
VTTSATVDPERSCFGKRSYTSEQTGEEVANYVWLERHVSLRVYFCDVCLQWHLTKLGAPNRVKPGFHAPLRTWRERQAFNEKQGRRRRGRK